MVSYGHLLRGRLDVIAPVRVRIQPLRDRRRVAGQVRLQQRPEQLLQILRRADLLCLRLEGIGVEPVDLVDDFPVRQPAGQPQQLPQRTVELRPAAGKIEAQDDQPAVRLLCLADDQLVRLG